MATDEDKSSHADYEEEEEENDDTSILFFVDYYYFRIQVYFTGSV